MYTTIILVVLYIPPGVHEYSFTPDTNTADGVIRKLEYKLEHIHVHIHITYVSSLKLYISHTYLHWSYTNIHINHISINDNVHIVLSLLKEWMHELWPTTLIINGLELFMGVAHWWVILVSEYFNHSGWGEDTIGIRLIDCFSGFTVNTLRWYDIVLKLMMYYNYIMYEFLRWNGSFGVRYRWKRGLG